MFDERVRRLNEIVPLFIDAGLQPVHENCMNYGGMGAEYSLRLLEAAWIDFLIRAIRFLLMIKQTTTVSKAKPVIYCKVKEHIAYVHIKDDCCLTKIKCIHLPRRRSGDVRAIVKDLLDNGYDGGISMEPHLLGFFMSQTAALMPRLRWPMIRM